MCASPYFSCCPPPFQRLASASWRAIVGRGWRYVYHRGFASGGPVNRRNVNLTLLGLMLAALWLLLSGLFKPVLLGLGTAAVLLTLLLTSRTEIMDAARNPISAGLRFLRYWPWLSVEIVKSSIDVARRVLSPSMPISPTVFEVRASQRTDMGRVVFANSITLTPGTVTMDVDGDLLRVHALSRESVDYLLEGEMDRRVTRTEGEG
jgi:multicomponent Na+:H+ antiporter subunit E